MYGEWIVARSSSIGNRHIEENRSCQDANNVFYDSKWEYGIAVVCDGAGSAINSDIGSNFIANNAVKEIENHFSATGISDFLKSDKKEIESYFVSFFKELHSQLEVYANSKDLPLKSLASTVIIVLFSKLGLVCSHIGDGRAGFQDIENNWFPILDPYKGEEANHTVFLTSDIWNNPHEFVRTCVINQKIQSFTLMSDGCENATYQLNKFNDVTQLYERLNNPHPKFFNPNVNALRQLHSAGKTTAEIDELWASYLHNGNEKFQLEIDDKTLILATLKDNEINA